MAEANLHHGSVSEELYDSAARFLRDEVIKVGSFKSWFKKENENYSVQIFKVMERMNPSFECENCTKEISEKVKMQDVRCKIRMPTGRGSGLQKLSYEDDNWRSRGRERGTGVKLHDNKPCYGSYKRS